MLVVEEVVAAVRAVPHWRSRHRSHGGRRQEHDEEDHHHQQEPAAADRAVLPMPAEEGE